MAWCGVVGAHGLVASCWAGWPGGACATGGEVVDGLHDLPSTALSVWAAATLAEARAPVCPPCLEASRPLSPRRASHQAAPSSGEPPLSGVQGDQPGRAAADLSDTYGHGTGGHCKGAAGAVCAVRQRMPCGCMQRSNVQHAGGLAVCTAGAGLARPSCWVPDSLPTVDWHVCRSPTCMHTLHALITRSVALRRS